MRTECVTEVTHHDQWTVVTVHEKEVDQFNAPALKVLLLELLEAGVDNLVLDLSDTTFIDSTTLGVLVGVIKRLRPHGEVKVVSTHEGVLGVFKVTGLNRVFPLFDTVAEATS